MNTERSTLEFDWDEHNIRHIGRHGVSASEFEEAMRNERVFIHVDDERGEERWYKAGTTNGLRVLELVYTVRKGKISPITAWDARRDVREYYLHSVGQSNE
jgi:uncharacterized DUF497 family protein